MKKMTYYTYSILLAIGIITSCGKATKGKLINEWRVVSYAEITTNGETVNTFSTNDSPQTPNTLTIKKDGTWIWNKESTASGAVFGGSVFITHKESTTQRGTWSFIEKTKGDDFRKNERIIFNILSEVNSTSETGGGGNPAIPDTTVTSSQTYLTGEKTIIYTVKESTRKSLKLESESSHFNSSQGVYSRKITISLEEKE